LFRTEQHRVSAVNEQAAEITVPSFANPAETRFTADSGRNRPRFRNEIAHRSEMKSPTIPG
jgi:hypothetical protein